MNDLNSKRPISKHALPAAAGPSRMLGQFQTAGIPKVEIAANPRRTTHGGCAWSLPSRDGNLAMRQPQDGALTHAAHSISTSMLNALRSKPVASVPADANDDKLSGATRSLASRILGLNGMKPLAKPVLDADADRYFSEHSLKLRTEPVRKGPDAGRKFTRLGSPQTNVA
jgi:hypothetical protein